MSILQKLIRRLSTRSDQVIALPSGDDARRLAQELDKKQWGKRVAAAEGSFDERNWPEAIERWRQLAEVYGDFHGTASKARLAISVSERLLALEYPKWLGRHRREVSGNPRVVVYTAIVGNYDALRIHECINENFRYVVFSDNDIPDLGLFDVRPIPFHEDDPTRAARYVKTHPHHLLEDCDIAIWIDSNIMIVEPIEKLIEQFLASGRAVAAIPHPQRETLQQEVAACAERSKDDLETMVSQLDTYSDGGFKTKDLIESNFLMIDLRQQKSRVFLDAWWREISKFSRRDQLSINFALCEAGINPHWITQKPHSVRDHPSFAFSPHDRGEGPAQVLFSRLNQVVPSRARDVAVYADVKAGRLAAVADKEIDIVVCVHNALEDVRACLASVERKRADLHRLIIVDDGSGKETREFLSSFKNGRDWVTVHRNATPRGYTKAANIGIRLSSASFVILLNSDTVVTDQWAEKMADAVFSTPGAGIVGPMSNAASHQSLPDHIGSSGQTAINTLPPGLSADDMNSLCEQWANPSFLPRVPLVHGFCFGVTREALDKLGPFDEELFPNGYGEENDYCMRATNAGVGLVLATHTYVYHVKSKSYSSEKRVALMKAGSEAFNKRHGRSRIRRCVLAMQTNPELVRLRELARKLF